MRATRSSHLTIVLLLCSGTGGDAFDANLSGILSVLRRIITSPGSFDTPLPDYFEEAKELTEKRGYSFEKYEVTTDDGFILEMHRVGQTRTRDPGPPVFLMPGFIGVSDTFLLRNDSLAFLLVDAGYDVWIGNSRGTHYSRRHAHLNNEDKAFWDYSIHEVGYYDIPAFVDLVLDRTSRSKLLFVGYSMGNTALFITTSMRPEYNRKLVVTVAMPPVASAVASDDINSPLIRFLLLNVDLIYRTLNQLEVGEVLPRVSAIVSLLHDLVADPRTRPFSFDALGLLIGEHRNNLNQETFSIEGPHIPAGTSLKQFYHQLLILKKGFIPLDLGPQMNLVKYNSTTPPLYSLRSTTSPVVVFYSDNDPFASVESALNVAETLPNVVFVQEMPTGYTHGDYFLGMDCSVAVNRRILHIFDRFSGKI